MRLAIKDTMKPDHGKDHKCLKKENRKERAQSKNFPNILKTRRILMARG
jgi:hypothetical protein